MGCKITHNREVIPDLVRQSSQVAQFRNEVDWSFLTSPDISLLWQGDK
jgi:hypothetical protein